MTRPLRIALAVAGAFTLGMAPRAAAQDAGRTANNVIYAEALGNAVVSSVNFERFVSNDLAVRVGLGAWAGGDEGDDSSIFIVPVMLTYLAGRGSSHAELGLGAGLVSGTLDFEDLGDADVDGVYGTGTLGYRYQRPGGGLVVRVGFTPVFVTDGFLSWGGLSIGYAF